MRSWFAVVAFAAVSILAGGQASAVPVGTAVQGCNGLACGIGPTPQGFAQNATTVTDPGVEFVDNLQAPDVQVHFAPGLMTFTRASSPGLGNSYYAFMFPDVTIVGVEFVSGTIARSFPEPQCNPPDPWPGGLFICMREPISGMYLRFDAHTIILGFDNYSGELSVPGPITETFKITVAQIPEPASLLLVATGLVLLRRRRAA